MKEDTRVARRPRASDLRDATQFRLVGELAMDKPAEFIRSHMWKTDPASLAFYTFLLVSAVLFGWELFVGTYQEGDRVIQLVFGALLSVALMPIHEAIHWAVYKWLGAPKVKFVAEWRKGLVYTIADRFVVTGREYMGLAAAPVLALSATLGLAYIALPEFGLVFSGLMCVHAISCIGDIAVINFIRAQDGQPLYAYDDSQLRKSYFYVKLDRA